MKSKKSASNSTSLFLLNPKRNLVYVLRFILLICILATATPLLAADLNDYTVQPGDTLFSISRKYGINVGTLASANNLMINSWLYVGQRLVIPNSEPAFSPAPVTPARDTVYVVKPGDTLMTIAMRHGVRVSQLAAANGLAWTSWVYVGQRLTIPGTSAAPAPEPTPEPAPESSDSYVVKAGDNLFRIALRHGVSVASLKAANGLSSNIVYVGQRLHIPGTNGGTPTDSPAPAPGHGTGGEKWIDVNLSTQTVTAYEGQTPVYSALASTGLWGTPTVVGTYHIYAKYVSTTMSGPGYYLPGVPHTMYFYRGYAIHGAYWHNNFGTPMSHGCVNLSLPDAEWFYNWAPMETKVVTHY